MKKSAVLPYLCALGAVAGCSVVLEGIGPPRDLEAPGAMQDGGPLGIGLAGAGGGVDAGSQPFEAGAGPGGGSLGSAGNPGAGGNAGGQPGPDAGQADDGGTPGGEGPDAQNPPSQCQLDGRFALDFSLDVLWEGTEYETALGLWPVIDEGAGNLNFVLLADFTSTTQGATVLAHVCGTTVPDFVSSLLEERYAARFGLEVWDSTAMPHFSFELQTECREPGCQLVSERIHAPLGADLEDPAGQWPASQAAGLWPDHDGDGELGITAQMLGPESQDTGGQRYSYPPVSLLRRVSQIMLAIRIQLLLEGQLTDCDSMEGHTREANVDSRALGCTAETPPTECTSDEFAFLDSNLPKWAVVDGKLQGVRLEAGANCAAARAAFQ